MSDMIQDCNFLNFPKLCKALHELSEIALYKLYYIILLLLYYYAFSYTYLMLKIQFQLLTSECDYF